MHAHISIHRCTLNTSSRGQQVQSRRSLLVSCSILTGCSLLVALCHTSLSLVNNGCLSVKKCFIYHYYYSGFDSSWVPSHSWHCKTSIVNNHTHSLTATHIFINKTLTRIYSHSFPCPLVHKSIYANIHTCLCYMFRTYTMLKLNHFIRFSHLTNLLPP